MVTKFLSNVGAIHEHVYVEGSTLSLAQKYDMLFHYILDSFCVWK